MSDKKEIIKIQVRNVMRKRLIEVVLEIIVAFQDVKVPFVMQIE